MSNIKIGRYVLSVSNPDKILFAQPAIRKQDLVAYYAAIAPIMLPYLKNRLISMQRFPDGIEGEGFYQKDAGDYFPAWIARKNVKKEGGTVDYVMINNAATLVYLATQAVVTVHTWLSKVDKLDYPDRIIFDFDPSPSNSFSQIRVCALQARDLLAAYGLTAYVMTTGSKGLHVVVPIKRELPFEQVKKIARAFSSMMVERNEKLLTLEVRKNKRAGRIFVDFLRNEFGQTGVAPYSVRPLRKAPVATPLTWAEVERGRLSPQQWTVKNIFARLARMDDPWKGMMRNAASLKRAYKLITR